MKNFCKKWWKTLFILAVIMVFILVVAKIVSSIDTYFADSAKQDIIDAGLVSHTVTADGESWMGFVKNVKSTYEKDALREQLIRINREQAQKGFVSTEIIYPGDLVLIPKSYVQ